MNEVKNTEIKNSMPEIFVNFLSFILLGIVATAVGVIFFQVVNKYFPDVLSAAYRNYQISGFSASAIHYSIASLIVGFPIYIWALWFWFKSFASAPIKSESKLSKWLTYVILLIASSAIIGDLITVVFNFLQGEYGARFLLKALAILVIAGLVFGFYFLERKRIQYKKEVSPALFLILLAFSVALIILAIVLGFFAGGTPRQARLRNLDLQRISNLQIISSAISNFTYDNNRLPKDLSEIRDNPRYNFGAGYVDPETRKEYDYKIVKSGTADTGDSLEYELCATFSTSNLNDFQQNTRAYAYSWASHDKGYVCEKQIATFGKLPLPIEKATPSLR